MMASTMLGDGAAQAMMLLPVVLLMMMTLSTHQQVLAAVPVYATADGMSIDKTALVGKTDALGRRHLLATGQPKANTFSQCGWDDDTGLGCVSKVKLPLGVDADLKPLDVYQQYNLFALDRGLLCGAATDEAACSKLAAQRCFWRKDEDDPKESYCMSMDYADERWFSGTMNYAITAVNDIPTAFTCPGSKLRWFLGCYQVPRFAGDDACKAFKGCTPYGALSKRRCYPSWFIEAMNEEQTSSFIDGVLALHPAYVGDCAAACWLRQAQACNTTGTTKAKCERQEYCEWFGGICTRYIGSITSEDPFNEAVTALRRQCWKLDDKGKEACNNKMVEGQQIGKWLKWGVGGEKVKCSIATAAPPSTPDTMQQLP